MATKIQVRRDTAANWMSVNPTLSAGEWGFETDTGRVKIGDGTTAWTTLTYKSMDALTMATIVGGLTAKATPIDADKVGFWDSVTSAMRNFTLANLWTWIQAKIYGATPKTTPIDTDSIAGVDSAASNVTTRWTLANIWIWIKAKLVSDTAGTVGAIEAGSAVTTPADTDILPSTSAAHVLQKHTWLQIVAAMRTKLSDASTAVKGLLSFATTGVEDSTKTIKALGAEIAAILTAGGFTLTAPSGANSLDGIADTATWKRTKAAAANMINSRTQSALWDYAKAVTLNPDTLTEMVESASAGAATVVYDDLGYPSMMYIIRGPINCAHLHADFGDAATPHPAFVVNAATKMEILIGMFDATSYNGGAGARAVVWPGLFPTCSLDFDASKALCTTKGSGWHLMSIWENALVEWLAMKNATEPRGNTYYGRSHESGYEYESAVRSDGLAPGYVGGTAKHRNGSGPSKWSHNHERWGLHDMSGNVWRWVDQLKIVGGEVFLTDNNYFTLAEASWPTTGAFFDGAGKLWGTAHTGAYTGAVQHTSQVMDAGYDSLALAVRTKLLRAGVTTKLAQASANPFVPKGSLWVDATAAGERLPICGGYWSDGSYAGLAALDLSYARSVVYGSIGFRPAFISLS